MKSMRIPLIIALGIAVMGIIFGSFFDLNISTAIASPTNKFALTISAIGPTIGFAAVAAMGGGFIVFGLQKDKYHIALRILFFVLAVACYGVSVYYPAGEYFGINGFYEAAPKWVGYLIVILPEAGAMVGGYFLFKDYKNDKMWIIFLIIVGLLLIALLGIIPMLKDTMHRPRYRTISTTPVDFYNWWEPCKNYKDLMKEFGIESDNFKSYPSGHTAEAAIFLVPTVFLPLANDKFKKAQLPIFLGGCALVLLVALARILAAAHYLSDVSFGATIMLTLLFIANEVVMNIKALQLKQEEKVEEPAPAVEE